MKKGSRPRDSPLETRNLVRGDLDVAGVDFGGGFATEDLEEHLGDTLLVVHRADKPFDAHEGATGDPDAVVGRKGLGVAAALFGVGFHVVLDVGDFGFRHRGDGEQASVVSAGDGADEVTDAVDRLDLFVNVEVQDAVLVDDVGLDEGISGEDKLVKGDFLAEAVVFLELFLGDDHFGHGRDAFAQGSANALFLSRKDSEGEPLRTSLFCI